MTLEECYQKLNGNYAEARQRLMTEKLMDRFVLKFPGDPSMDQLREALSQGSRKDAFRAVHTLKGVAANMAFTQLQEAASDLTEQMRSLEYDADPVLLQKVEDSYRLVIETIAAYEKEK